MKFRGHSRYINIRVVLNAKCINIKRGSKFSWLLKIFGSIHDVSNISHYFACYLELYNQKKKNALNRQPFSWNTSNAILLKEPFYVKCLTFIRLYDL